MKDLKIKLDAFEGPLDLLFYLIEKNKIDIYDIPIYELTSQYMNYLEEFENKNMENISEFLVMAASLLEIKSKMLLPKINLEENEIDPREELVLKLIEYKKYKEITKFFNEKEIFINTVVFKQQEKDLIEYLIKDKIVNPEDILDGVTLENLYEVFQDVLLKRELKIDKVRSSFSKIKKDDYTIEGQKNYIQNLLEINEKILFTEIFQGVFFKMEIIVTFLALLELIKINKIKVTQKNVFENILIEKF